MKPLAIVKRGNVWQVQVRVGKDAAGKWIRKSATADTEAEAKKIERRLLTQADTNRAAFITPTRETVEQYLTRWVRAKRQGNPPDWERATYVTNESLLRNHVLPVLGAVRVANLSPTAIQRMLDDIRAGRGAAALMREKAQRLFAEGKKAAEVSETLGISAPTLHGWRRGTGSAARTIAKIHALLDSAFEDAVRLGLLIANPVDRTRVPKQPTPHADGFALEDLDALFLAAVGTRVANLLPFAVYSGLRRGECLGLKWADVDWDAGAVTVRRQYIEAAGQAELKDRTKTPAGMRTTTLPTPALAALRAQRKAQTADKAAALEAGVKYQDGDWVFATHAGDPLLPRNAYRGFVKARDKAGLRKLPFHAQRHTMASVELGAGVPLPIVSKRLGHKRVSLTADLYGHLLVEADRAAAEAVDAFLARRQAGDEPTRQVAGEPARPAPAPRRPGRPRKA